MEKHVNFCIVMSVLVFEKKASVETRMITNHVIKSQCV